MRKVRAAVASLAVVAGIGTFLAACGLALSPRRKRRIPADVSDTEVRLQQLTRYRAADGTQSIHGTLIAEFAPGERSATLYVAFCPPLERLPTVEAEAIDDASASVKLTQLLHNGVQLDVRLPQPANDKQTVTVEMVATD
jgi:hypothetical protein